VNTANGLQAQTATWTRPKGDDFAANVNEGKATRPARVLDGHWHGHRCGIYSTRSMRPNLFGHRRAGHVRSTMQSGKRITAVASLMLASAKARASTQRLRSVAIRCSRSGLQGIARIAS